MISGGNVAANPSGKNMEGDNGLKTVECLRGRLLAERTASRVANQEAEQLGNKLIELEKQLRREVKSRNRAEKRLKSLRMKLESIDKAHAVSDDSEHSNSTSSLLEKSEITSLSSSTISSTNPKCPEDDKEPIPNSQITNSTKSEFQEPMKGKASPFSEETLRYNVTTTSSEDHIVLPLNGKIESNKAITKNPNDLECIQKLDDPRKDEHMYVKIVCKVH